MKPKTPVPTAKTAVPDDEKQSVVEVPSIRTAHATLRYTTFRLAIFVVALALLWLVRVRGVLLIALALLVSGLASYTLLRGQRDAMSMQFATAAERRRQRSAARAAREDDVADQLAGDAGEAGDAVELGEPRADRPN